MTVVGEVFVVLRSEIAPDFTSNATREIEQAGAFVAGRLNDQFSRAGADSGQSFVAAAAAPISGLADEFATAGTNAGAGFLAGVSAVSDTVPSQFAQAGVEAGAGFLAGTADLTAKLPEQFAAAGTESGAVFAQGAADVTAKLPEQFAQAGAAAGQGFASTVQGPIADSASEAVVGLQRQFSQAGLLSGNAFVDRLTRGISSIGGPRAAGVAAAVAIVASVTAVFSSIGAEFGKARKQIVLESGATADEVDRLFSSVRASVLQVPAALTDAATAFDLLFKRGVPIGPLLDKLAAQELTLARITKSELGATVDSTTALFAKFNVPLREQSRELDVLFKASQRSGKSLGDLVDPLLSGGTALAQFGFSLDKSVALITQLQIAGVNVQPALASLRKAFSQIASEGGDPQKALADLIAEFRDGTDPAQAMADAIQLFGARAGLELATAIQKGKFEVSDLLAIITNGKDGILATGEATLGLGEKFTLLRNRASETFSEIGIAVRRALSTFVSDATGPVLQLAEAVAHLIVEAAPLARVLAPIGLLLSGILPGLGAFATGIDAIATGLSVLNTPLGLVAAGVILLGTNALAIVSILNQAAEAAKAFTLALLRNPYVAAAAAIIALGIAVQSFRSNVDPAIKLSQDLGKAIFEANSSTTIFRAGIDSATQGVKDFIVAEANAKNSGLSVALTLAGKTVDGLAKAVTGSATAWDAYAASVAAGLKAQGTSKGDFVAITSTLEDQRQAFELSARAQLDMAVATDVLTKRQAEFVIGQHKNADGSRNFAAELDDVNRRLSVQAEKQNSVVLAAKGTGAALDDLAHQLAEGTLAEKDAEVALAALGLTGEEVTVQLDRLKLKAQDLNATTDTTALHAASTSAAYGDLARNLASGRLSISGATLALEDMGLSAAGAATAASDLDSAVRSFVDGAVSQLPTVAKAIGDFASQIKDDQDTLASDREKNVQLHEQVNEALAKSSADTRAKLASIDLAIQQDQAKIASGSTSTTDKLQRDLLKRSQIIAGSGQASADLAKQVAESNAAIIADNKKLADDQNPNRFTKNLLDQVVQIATFTTNLRKIIRAGFAPLAGELASQGPEIAGGLAKAFAGDPAKAAIASAVITLRQKTQDSFQTLLEENAGPLTGVGAKQGLAIGKAIADGITRELLNNFPLLRQLGITTGDEILGGAKEGAGKTSVTDPIAAQIRLHIPEFRGLGVPVGTAVGQGVGDGLGNVNLTPGLARTLNQHREEFTAAGASLGEAAGAGIAEGILSQRIKVGDAILSVTKYGVSVAQGAWKVQSPSRVFAEIGAQVGAGLAQGITSSVSTVGEAAAALASGVTSSVEGSLANVNTIRFDLPTRDAVAAGQRFGASVADGLATSVDDVARASDLVVSRASESFEALAFTPVITPTADLRDVETTLAQARFASTVRPVLDDRQLQTALDAVTVTPTADLSPLATALRSLRAAPTVAPRADLVAFASEISTTRFAATITPDADLSGVNAQIDRETFAPLVRPLGDLAPLRNAIDSLAFAPTVTPLANLAPLVASVNAARFVPEVIPTVDLGPLSERIAAAPFTVTPAVNLVPVTNAVEALAFAPVVTPSADLSNLVTSVDAVRLAPTVIPTADLSGVSASLRQLSFAPVVTPTLDPATFSTKGTEAGAALGAGVVTGVDAASPAVQDAFARVTTPAFSVDVSALRPIGERLGNGVAEGLDQAGLHVDNAATKLSERLTRTLGDVVDPSLTPGQGLVDSFHRAFGKIGDDAEQLRKFLLALGGTKFAPDQPPSGITIAEQGQSIQVPRPIDRADAQTPRAAGLTVNQTFNETIDPLHVAAELAWQLL